MSMLRSAGYAVGHGAAEVLAKTTEMVLDGVLPTAVELTEMGIERGAAVVYKLGHIAGQVVDKSIGAIPQEHFDKVIGTLAVPVGLALDVKERAKKIIAKGGKTNA